MQIIELTSDCVLHNPLNLLIHLFPVSQMLESQRRSLLTALGQLQDELQHCQTRVHCCVAGALVILRSLQGKLNPIIRPLMDCVKLESDALLQVSGRSLKRVVCSV